MSEIVTPPSASTVRQFCNRLSIGRTKAHQLIADGTVKSFKLGSRRLVVNSSIDALFDAAGS